MQDLWCLSTAVVITAYDRPKALARCIDSIHEHFERATIIVGDNGKEPVEDVMRVTRDRTPFYIRLPFDFGLSATRNYLVDEAGRQGFPYVLICDDDFVFTEKTDIQELHRLVSDGYGEIASGHIRKENRPMCASRFYLRDGKIVKHLFQANGPDPQRMDFGGTLILAPVSVLKRCRFDDRLMVGEHVDFYLRAWKQGLRSWLCPSVEVLDGPGLESRHDDKEYLDKRNRALQLNRQALTRWARYVAPVEYVTNDCSMGECEREPLLAIPDNLFLPDSTPLEGTHEKLGWPCHRGNKPSWPRNCLLMIYNHGGMASITAGTPWTEPTKFADPAWNNQSGTVEAFWHKESGTVGAVPRHPWIGECLRRFEQYQRRTAHLVDKMATAMSLHEDVTRVLRCGRMQDIPAKCWEMLLQHPDVQKHDEVLRQGKKAVEENDAYGNV